jgi:CheY-like chemotaxis protein
MNRIYRGSSVSFSKRRSASKCASRIVPRSRFLRPHLILLDVDMPGKDGGDVAREIQAEPALCSVPILFLTSLVSTAEAGNSEIVRGGMRFLAKPVNPKILIDTVDRMLVGEVLAA